MKEMLPFYGMGLLAIAMAITTQGQAVMDGKGVEQEHPKTERAQPATQTQHLIPNTKAVLDRSTFANSLTTKASSKTKGDSCICSEYVEHRIPAYPETLSAQQLEQYGLEEAGFKRYDRPVPGAIVLYQPGVLGSDPQAGHVEIVESVDSRGVPTISTSGPSIPAIRADAGCLNVRTSKKEKLAIAQPGVSYWRL